MLESTATTAPQDFLWITKTIKSKSLSSTDPTEASTINSHSQRWKRRGGSLSRSKSRPSSRNETRPRKRAKLQNAPDVSLQPSPVLSEVSIKTESTQSDEPEVAVINSPITSDDALDLFERDSPARVVPQLCREPGTGIDPFQTAVIHMDHQANVLLQYYAVKVYPPIWQSIARVRNLQPHRFELATREVIQDHFCNELHITCLLAAMASRMEHLDKCHVQLGSSAFITKAITAVREHLATNPEVTTNSLLDVFCLFRAEIYRFNYLAAWTHMKAARDMTEQLGGLEGLEKIDRNTMESLIVADLFLAVEFSSPPLFQCSYDPGTADSLRVTICELDPALVNLGSGLLSHVRCSVVNETLQSHVKDMVECAKLFYADKISSDANVVGWSTRRRLAIRHRLCSYSEEDPRSEALRIALLIWAVDVLTLGSQYGALRTIRVVAPRLRCTLERAREEYSSWTGHTEVLLWILTVGAMALDGGKDQVWFIEQIVTLTSYAKVPDGAHIQALLERSLYIHKVQHESLKKITDKVVAMRQRFQILDRISCSPPRMPA